MKRIATAVLATLMLASPVAITSASAQGRGDYGRDRDYDRDRDGDRDRDYNRGDRGRHNGWNRDNNRRGDRWDRRRHNGYTYNGRWYYGPPPAAYYGRVDYGYHQWRRGDRLPPYYRNQYVVVNDYHRYGYRSPPRGYHYVRDDRGDVLLVAIATGVILSAILNN